MRAWHVCFHYILFYFFDAVPWELAKTKTLITRDNDSASTTTKTTTTTTGRDTELKLDLDELRPNVLYKVRIFAVNSLGKGQPSHELRVRNTD